MVLVLISFPPMTGHTTTVTLCGFAYGMKGFFIGLAGSVLGAAFVFVVLRFLFSKRLQKWAATNDKWTALETVAVSICSGSVNVGVFTRALGSPESQRPSVGDSDSGVFHATLGIFQHTLRRESPIRNRHLRQLIEIPVVDTHRRALAVRRCNVLPRS